MRRILIAVGAALLLLTSWAAASDVDLKTKGREVLSRTQAAIVSISIVAHQRISVGGREMNKEETKSEVVGTIISPDGLTVVSNFLSNPLGRVADMMGKEGGPRFESEVSGVNLELGDGTEVPARFVLRDKDLDLAFLKPVDKPAKPLPFVSLEHAARQAQVLDDLIFIGRLGRAADRESTVSLGRVEAVVHKPRTYYVPTFSLGMLETLGCPVFNANGEVVGLNLVRLGPQTSDFSGLFGGLAMVVLPAEDVAEVARQATSGGAPGTTHAK